MEVLFNNKSHRSVKFTGLMQLRPQLNIKNWSDKPRSHVDQLVIFFGTKVENKAMSSKDESMRISLCFSEMPAAKAQIL